VEDKFQQIQTYLDKGVIPPVEQWNPDFCGDSQMRILRNGTWLHQNTPLGRENLVKLFASVLKREEDDYFLVTPVEKLSIQVDVAPFVIVDLEVDGSGSTQKIKLKTNLGERFYLDSEHPLTIANIDDETVALVTLRRNLPAVINSSTFVQLSELAYCGYSQFIVESCGEQFVIGEDESA